MILILNCGSQSIKWKVYDSSLKLKAENSLNIKKGELEAINRFLFKKILKKELKSINFNVETVGHRVVHGGIKFQKPLKITEDNLKELERFNTLAPLHNPYNILGIRTAQEVFPKSAHMAVFDTEFYGDLPEVAYRYALPEELIKKHGFRKFGFHGISHEYAIGQATKKLKKPFKSLKIISCHLGGGSSITAVKNGKAVDTSMGFTPLEGLIMMTRPGDLDAGIVLDLSRKYLTSTVGKILNNQSGLKAVCQSSDMLDILKRKDKKAKLALDMYVYRIQKYIGGYYAVLGGCDALVFTGKIGAGLGQTRKMILKGLNILDKTKVIVVNPNEELAIAQKICLKN